MTDERAPVLVVGLGNELFTDEGIGVYAARRLAEMDLPGVDVVDGGTLGMYLLPEVVGRDSLVIIDALVARGSAPGDVVVLDGDELPYGQPGAPAMSPHQVGIIDALEAADFHGEKPRRVKAVGMVPVSLESSVGLSAEGEARLDDVVDAVLKVLADWGITPSA